MISISIKNVTLKINPNKLNLINQCGAKALANTAYAVADDLTLSQVVPKDTGILEASVAVIHDSLASISYNTPYARRLYFHPEYNFRTDKNPYAKGLWMQDYHTAGTESFNFLVNSFKEDFKEALLEKGVIE